AGSDVVVDAAGRAQAGAVGATQRDQRQVEEQRVPDHRLQVDDVLVEPVGLAFEGLGPEELVDVDGDLAGDGLQAAAAGRRPGGRDLAADDDALGDPLEHEVEVYRSLGGDLGGTAAQPAEGDHGRDRARVAGVAERGGQGNA